MVDGSIIKIRGGRSVPVHGLGHFAVRCRAALRDVRRPASGVAVPGDRQRDDLQHGACRDDGRTDWDPGLGGRVVVAAGEAGPVQRVRALAVVPAPAVNVII